MKCVIIFVISMALSAAGNAQQPATSDSYPHKGTPQTIISNRTIGYADTTLAMLTGQVRDSQNMGIYGTTLNFTDLHSRKAWDMETDTEGRFKRYIRPGEYSIEFRAGGYGQVTIDTLKLNTGQIQEIIISGLFRRIDTDWVTIPAKEFTFSKKRNHLIGKFKPDRGSDQYLYFKPDSTFSYLFHVDMLYDEAYGQYSMLGDSIFLKFNPVSQEDRSSYTSQSFAAAMRPNKLLLKRNKLYTIETGKGKFNFLGLFCARNMKYYMRKME
jgi:Carboxypeptidase regulatory-like domain